MNRKEINTALAKALAYANCGKFDGKLQWAGTEQWFDILCDGRPVYTIFARNEIQAAILARQVDANTGKLAGKTIKPVARIH